ncbi:MAG: hypothetical protein ABI723_00485 [Bacteroidia bacterium]
MKANVTSSSTAIKDWPLSAANHKIDLQPAQNMISAHTPAGHGAYFTLNTIKGIITPVNAGIRYYFTIHNNVVTVMITGVKKIDIGKYDDLIDAKLAVGNSLNIVPANTDQSIALTDAALCNRTYRASANFADGRKGGMFGIEAINEIIRQTGCAGLRFCFAKDADGVKTIVLYGVDTTGQNLNTYVGDQNCPCPNFCGAVNPLNS